jgi:hypothetical protein
MSVEVSEHRPEKREAINTAWIGEWGDETELDSIDKRLVGVSEGYLCGGESEDAFVERLSRAIWEANGEYCGVRITAIYLEDQPTTEYDCDREQYDAWKTSQKKK